MTPDQALNRAAAYCSQAERAPQDVEDKLRNWEVSDEDIEQIMQRLRDDNFLNEERYVHAFINDKFLYERWGRIKIIFALRQKGISGSIVNNTLDDVIDPDAYLETLTDLLRAKMRGMSVPLDQRNRAKLYRFAQQRGFEAGFISRALSVLNSGSDDDDF